MHACISLVLLWPYSRSVDSGWAIQVYQGFPTSYYWAGNSDEGTHFTAVHNDLPGSDSYHFDQTGHSKYHLYSSCPGNALYRCWLILSYGEQTHINTGGSNPHIWIESKFAACLCTWLIHACISLVLHCPYSRSVDGQQVKSSKEFQPHTIQQDNLIKVRTLLLFTMIYSVLIRAILIKMVPQKYHLYSSCPGNACSRCWHCCEPKVIKDCYLLACNLRVSLLLDYLMHLTVINAHFVLTIPYSRSINNKSSLARFSDVTLVQAMHSMVSLCPSASLFAYPAVSPRCLWIAQDGQWIVDQRLVWLRR
jgi:hypothetical protein